MSAVTKDLQGRPYATVTDTKAGDKIVADGDFTCIEPGSTLLVLSDPEAGELYVECAEGRHHLDGQIQGSIYMGLYPADAS